MKESVNREGLTFEEWVCAAGVAVFNNEMVRPYTTSWTIRVPVTAADRNVSDCVLRKRVRRESQRFYPLSVRKAWKAGEDPSEWRA